MKKITLIFAFGLMLLIASTANASTDDKGGTKLKLWIPGFLVKIAGKVADNQIEEIDGNMLKHFGSITICVREGKRYSPDTDKKINRKLGRLEKKNYEELLSVNSSITNVSLQVKENTRGIIKRFVVLVDEPGETYVYLKINCRIKANKLPELISECKIASVIL